ncbi:bifunctional 5,10-methylenetetrahydrofolate dehydrogenase/5,10-methenyltetrahydrofolate cyclohydrolase [Mesotoga sp.]|uniref:bifunctional 5,10-methylenetetrahydrofolate dehydrogenase/5,10-methenyltetrahydrofolate cyclohydrolase n=1 Tax=Mesotoga sp. TaxID=2053577 RepID=UPI002BAE9BC8|nr:bifunctional 5,10-methylenetetrahydrofolate dehydrogenase/5,10-methenyltetrahydrofolate cyclohydrolase [Mesotoga sp.]HRX65060.1 bifunctional 5,10-methylenetetrahydrofolate dehydrogenase/5,10-methenyltetrahydrofolate cyclohydrolase [Mesotoga sp.]
MILDGKIVAENIYSEIREALKSREKGLPSLVLFCDEPDSSNRTYMKSINRQGDKLGIDVIVRNSGSSPVKEILQINEDKTVAGIMVMHPLKNADEKAVLAALSPEKDLEGRTVSNLGGIINDEEFFAPPTAEAVMEILNYYGIEIRGRDITIVGRSNTVGKPLALLFLKKGVDGTVTVCHSRSRDISEKTFNADIVVSAVGIAGFVKREMVRPGGVVVDVGINFVDGRLVGDVDFDEVSQIAAAITPVPGGVGSVTTALLFKHYMKSLERMES